MQGTRATAGEQRREPVEDRDEERSNPPQDSQTRCGIVSAAGIRPLGGCAAGHPGRTSLTGCIGGRWTPASIAVGSSSDSGREEQKVGDRLRAVADPEAPVSRSPAGMRPCARLGEPAEDCDRPQKPLPPTRNRGGLLWPPPPAGRPACGAERLGEQRARGSRARSGRTSSAPVARAAGAAGRRGTPSGPTKPGYGFAMIRR